MLLLSCSGETIHPPVDNSLKNRLSVAFSGLQRSVMNIEKPNSDLHSLTMAGIQSNVSIFCKIILNFLIQHLTPNYQCHLLTPWYIMSRSCKPTLSLQSKNIDFFLNPWIQKRRQAQCCCNIVLYHGRSGEGTTRVLGQRTQG